MHPLLNSYFGLIRKLLPNKSESSAIGVDIGSFEVKMVELKKSGDDFDLINWAIEPIRNGDVGTAISTVVNKSLNPPTDIIISIYGKGTLIRYIDMPRMNLNDLRNSFMIEADKYFPFAQDQIHTDCFILNPNDKSKKMRVLAAAAKKDVVEDRLKLLTDIGLQTHFIGLNPVAIANVFHALDRKKSEEQTAKVKAVFDFGASVSSLTVLVDGLPKFNRDIYIGGQELTKRIGNALGMPMEEAEALKYIQSERKTELQVACESLLMNLMQEIRLSFDYFSTENSLQIEELYVTGGSSNLMGLEQMLKDQLEIPVHIWDPFQHLKTSMTDEEKRVNASKLGVALGLALYHYD